MQTLHFWTHFWNKILRRNQAHEQSDWATVAQLNVEIKRDARKDKKKALIMPK